LLLAAITPGRFCCWNVSSRYLFQAYVVLPLNLLIQSRRARCGERVAPARPERKNGRLGEMIT
jgi:hypothetical protein